MKDQPIEIGETRKKALKDLFVIGLMALVLFHLSSAFGAFKIVSGWMSDEMIALSGIFVVAFATFSWRRWHDLRREVLERTRVEAVLHENEDYLKTLFDSIQTGVMVVDGETHRILDVNAFAVKILGLDKGEVAGHTCHQFVCPAEEGKCPVTDLKQKVDFSEKVLVNARGEDIPILKSVVPVPRNGHLYLIESFVDISERKRAEEVLAQQAIELSRSNRELEQFAYVASHDLQEPLRMVTSYVQLLARRYRDKLDPDADVFINFAVEGASRMKKLINDLLTYSRVETRGRDFEVTDCGEVIGRALSNLQKKIEESRARISHDALPKVTVDPFLLRQLFINLIDNAIKFRGEAPPQIHISAKQEDHEWTFSVSDNGMGIAPEYGERIFVIFQRLHGREKYPGNGIGLAICKKIVEHHGGSIWVCSEPGKGSTFCFTLPAQQLGGEMGG